MRVHEVLARVGNSLGAVWFSVRAPAIRGVRAARAHGTVEL
ncbi:hypothetical protein [Nocardia sp. NPDC060249]